MNRLVVLAITITIALAVPVLVLAALDCSRAKTAEQRKRRPAECKSRSAPFARQLK